MAYLKLAADYGECDTLPFTNSTGGDLSAGDEHVEAEKLGVVYDDTPDTEDGVLLVGVPAPGIDISKATGNAFSAGDPVYWNTSNDNLDSTDTNALVGHAYEDAVSADTEVRVVLTNEQEVT